ncbi:MAG: hypothetical protein WED05_06430 [Candidatus Atabeyarchaeum deiterrae]
MSGPEIDRKNQVLCPALLRQVVISLQECPLDEFEELTRNHPDRVENGTFEKWQQDRFIAIS